MSSQASSSSGQLTILVHGIWMRGVAMKAMGWMLESRGFRTHSVSYGFLRHSPVENARSVHKTIQALDAARINLVGHSLGGIVILHLLHEYPNLPIDKVVLLGSPVRGSYVARQIFQTRLLRPLLGRSVEQGLLGGAPAYEAVQPLGIITGRGNVSLTAMFYRAGDDSDGVVRESETLLENASDRIRLPLSHSGLIFSRQCSDYVARFLREGHF